MQEVEELLYLDPNHPVQVEELLHLELNHPPMQEAEDLLNLCQDPRRDRTNATKGPGHHRLRRLQGQLMMKQHFLTISALMLHITNKLPKMTTPKQQSRINKVNPRFFSRPSRQIRQTLMFKTMSQLIRVGILAI
jgi:hypothetical protein